MQATLREFEDWLEDSVPDAVMIAYEKALAKLEECLPFEDTLVRLACIKMRWHAKFVCESVVAMDTRVESTCQMASAWTSVYGTLLVHLTSFK